MSHADATTDRRTLAVLAGVALLSLALRLFQLGGRVFHWDEGRVGYWIVRYHESGQFTYRPIIHGPFIQHVDALLFHLVPATDFWARFPIAVLTASLPVAAWLFRRHLDDVELVALGVLLALDPLVLYYSRFMRSDPLVGAFAFLSFAFLVRGWDTRDVRYGYVAMVTLALAFASKENALVYAACLVGAAALLYDHRLVRATTSEPVWARVRGDYDQFRGWAGSRSARVGPWLWAGGHAAGMLVVFVTVIVLMYAPRPDIWQAFGSPSAFVGVVEAGTIGAWQKFTGLWLGGEFQAHPYFSFLLDLLETLGYGSVVLLVLAVVGFVADGYLGAKRDLVAFTAYWGAVSVVGYPIATDIQAPWAAVHVVLPLAIPAAVGVGAIVDVGLRGVAREQRQHVLLSVLVLTAGMGGMAALNADYWNSTAEEDEQVLQWAQPANDMKPTLEKAEAVAAENEGVDVLFFGTKTPNGGSVRFYVGNESAMSQPPPQGPAWHSRLPLPWYFERKGANVTSTAPGSDPANLSEDAPPVVIAYKWDKSKLSPHLAGYAVYEHRFKLWGEHVVIYIDRDAMEAAGVDP
jgi:uncharacterized protein (TIGR03663 family)